MSSDARIFFASERTLLAWLRTGIAIVGLGFLVSRFGLILRVQQRLVVLDTARLRQSAPRTPFAMRPSTLAARR